MAVQRIPLSHSNILGKGKNIMVGPIDKEHLGKEAAIKKSEITTFEQARMIKEMESKLEVLQRESEEEEQTGVLDVKAEWVKNKSN